MGKEKVMKTLLLTPLFAFALGLYADEPKPAPKPAAKPAAKAPAAAPGRAAAPAAAPGRAGAPAAAPGRAGAPAAAAPGRAGAPAAGRGEAGRPEAGGRGEAARGEAGRGEARGPGGVAGRRDTPGSRPVALRGGGEARVDARGRVTDLHRGGMDVHRSPDGRREVRVERADHSRVVVGRGGHGYVQGRYMYGGHEYGHRTYYEHGRAYDRYYRRYDYHGVVLEGYSPVRYYSPAFYGYAYAPWAAPVPYTWGFVGNPWAVYYGGYFTPYPVYPSPAFWLTDYLIAAQLQAAYAAGAASAGAAAAMGPNPNNGAPTLVASLSPMAAPDSGAAPALTPAIKQMVADEVKGQIALENAEAQQNTQGQDADPASSGVERLMSDGKPHVFVAGDSVDVVDANGAECALSDGDVLQLNSAPAADSTDAQLTVLASKGAKECAASATVTVAVADLQEMQNHLRETIDQGMQELQSKQGQGGLPAAPPSAKAPPTETGFSKEAPPAEKDGEADVNAQLTEADKAEQEAAASTPAGGADGATPAAEAPAPAATVDIALGQTIDQVTASLGQPIAIVNLGPKKIYKYKDMKITFKDGKVSDVE